MKGVGGMWPIGCITASALYSLAHALNRLRAWHKRQGGNEYEDPCLRSIEIVDGEIIAKVYSGKLHWDLVYRHNDWIFRGDALK